MNIFRQRAAASCASLAPTGAHDAPSRQASDSKNILFIILFFLGCIFPNAHAADDFPKPSGLVNDFADTLSAAAKNHLEGALQSIARGKNIEIAVVTLKSLDDAPIEDVATKLFQAWGIGKKGEDSGVLFLIAPNEKKVRIEVGYGLEGILNDALAGRILDQAVLPRFTSGDIEGGIVSGALAIASIVARDPSLSPERPEQKTISLPWPFKILFFVVLLYLFIRHPWLFLYLMMFSGRGSGGSGGFSRGFGGFGGGLSGGGGASRGW